MPRLPTPLDVEPGTEILPPDVLLERAARAERDGRRDIASNLWRRVLLLDPTNLRAINQLGISDGERGDLISAVRWFHTSLRIDPNQPEVLFNLGVAQSRLGHGLEALVSFEGVIALSPHSGAGHLQYAASLTRLGRYHEAVAACDNAARLLPDDPLTAIHRGTALQWCGDYDQALSEFDRAIALRPDYAEAWVSKAMLMLLLGDFPGGFALYEWRGRMAARNVSPRRSEAPDARPLWLGKSALAGKTILLRAEQGLGDMIQFSRYGTLAADAGARVIIEVQPALTALMTTIPGVSQVVSNEEMSPEHDLQCPMMSLPLAFGSTIETIPAGIPYLRADPDRTSEWRTRLSAVRGLRVGLVWGAGSRLGDSELVALEQRKTVTLQALAPLAGVACCEYVSIQLGPASAQSSSPPPGMILHDFTRHLTDFAETAALMANLHLVISVCTSTAHLAGAMGKPVWLLNRFDTDWRWFLDQEDTPWYPTMRIFRQPRPGDWTPVIQAVTDRLRAFVAAPLSGSHRPPGPADR